MTAIVILNVVLAVSIVISVLSLLGWGIITDRAWPATRPFGGAAFGGATVFVGHKRRVWHSAASRRDRDRDRDATEARRTRIVRVSARCSTTSRSG
jgi:hypothetical protein